MASPDLHTTPIDLFARRLCPAGARPGTTVEPSAVPGLPVVAETRRGPAGPESGRIRRAAASER